MKYLTLTIALFATLLFAKDNKTTLKVEGMKCQYSCTGKLTTVVENIKGVKECTVDFEKGFATVVFDEKKLASKDIVDVLKEKTSYKVSEMKQQDTKKETGSI
ncbi:MAG: heavy-metal-associated domain-containing protein [Candidatus Neomarinimicrobiota bacterium]|nr:heavy-metal-associated domain-containing protein [Candidatus Neomarinimicrobiota bacterium]